MDVLEVRPIGVVRSPFAEKAVAPRQAVAEGALGVQGRIEVLPEYEHALEDLAGFDRIWILFWFHAASGPRGRGVPTKVLPPRSDRKRGLFATRSPHRPNPIGMSAVRLVKVEACILHVQDLDILDGTPVLDLKPYVPYADAFPEARAGWLEETRERDPRAAWEVRMSPEAEAQLTWLAAAGLALDLRTRIAESLALGPQPHPYRRIKKTDDGGLVLAAKEWRARFTVDAAARTLTVERLASGFRPRELVNGDGPELAIHGAFVARFG